MTVKSKVVSRAQRVCSQSHAITGALEKVKFPSSSARTPLCFDWPRESGCQASSPNSTLALSSPSQASPNFLSPATPTTNDHRDDSYPPKWYGNPLRTLSGALRKLERIGRWAQKMGATDSEAWNIATQRRRKRAVANTLPCAGHWTILPAAGRRPECRLPGRL